MAREPIITLKECEQAIRNYKKNRKALDSEELANFWNVWTNRKLLFEMAGGDGHLELMDVDNSDDVFQCLVAIWRDHSQAATSAPELKRKAPACPPDPDAPGAPGASARLAASVVRAAGLGLLRAAGQGLSAGHDDGSELTSPHKRRAVEGVPTASAAPVPATSAQPGAAAAPRPLAPIKAEPQARAGGVRIKAEPLDQPCVGVTCSVPASGTHPAAAPDHTAGSAGPPHEAPAHQRVANAPETHTAAPAAPAAASAEVDTPECSAGVCARRERESDECEVILLDDEDEPAPSSSGEAGQNPNGRGDKAHATASCSRHVEPNPSAHKASNPGEQADAIHVEKAASNPMQVVPNPANQAVPNPVGHQTLVPLNPAGQSFRLDVAPGYPPWYLQYEVQPAAPDEAGGQRRWSGGPRRLYPDSPMPKGLQFTLCDADPVVGVNRVWQSYTAAFTPMWFLKRLMGRAQVDLAREMGSAEISEALYCVVGTAMALYATATDNSYNRKHPAAERNRVLSKVAAAYCSAVGLPPLPVSTQRVRAKRSPGPPTKLAGSGILYPPTSTEEHCNCVWVHGVERQAPPQSTSAAVPGPNSSSSGSNGSGQDGTNTAGGSSGGSGSAPLQGGTSGSSSAGDGAPPHGYTEREVEQMWYYAYDLNAYLPVEEVEKEGEGGGQCHMGGGDKVCVRTWYPVVSASAPDDLAMFRTAQEGRAADPSQPVWLFKEELVPRSALSRSFWCPATFLHYFNMALVLLSGDCSTQADQQAVQQLRGPTYRPEGTWQDRLFQGHTLFPAPAAPPNPES